MYVRAGNPPLNVTNNADAAIKMPAKAVEDLLCKIKFSAYDLYDFTMHCSITLHGEYTVVCFRNYEIKRIAPNIDVRIKIQTFIIFFKLSATFCES